MVNFKSNMPTLGTWFIYREFQRDDVFNVEMDNIHVCVYTLCRPLEVNQNTHVSVQMIRQDPDVQPDLNNGVNSKASSSLAKALITLFDRYISSLGMDQLMEHRLLEAEELTVSIWFHCSQMAMHTVCNK